MSYELILWFVALLAVVAGGAMQSIAATISVMHPAVLIERAGRVQQLELLGDLTIVVVFSAVPLLAVYALGDLSNAVTATFFSTLVMLGARALAWKWARDHAERLARLLLGDVATFLALAEAAPTEPDAREETVAQMVDASEKAGLIESDERAMIAGILQLDRTLTREIMVPRIDVVSVEVDTRLRDALDVIIAGAHSRVPVYEGSIDHVVGVLYAKDLLKALRDGKTDAPLRALLRPACFVPESKRLDELLQELQANKVHMAIVVDEYGGTAGVVTIEDILEEIVGEIQDEYDTGEEPQSERIGQNEAVFDARVTIDDANEMLDLNLPTESDTLGGLVYQRLEKMPKVGDQVRVGDVVVSVINVTGRRIQKVRVARIAAENQDPDEASGK
jgi:CBS domain containing-hemolysin-like protein